MKSPERYLFRAVISQAIHDAMYNGLDKYYLIDKRNAIDSTTLNWQEADAVEQRMTYEVIDEKS